MIEGLFGKGKIYLFKHPVNGNSGIPRLTQILLDSNLPIKDESGQQQEIYGVFTNAKRSCLLVLHILGECIIFSKCRIQSKRFQILLSEDNTSIQLTREQLQKLVLEGNYQENVMTVKELENRLRRDDFAVSAPV